MSKYPYYEYKLFTGFEGSTDEEDWNDVILQNCKVQNTVLMIYYKKRRTSYEKDIDYRR